MIHDWINVPTIWRVEYEYADGNGGGHQVAYFRTQNRYTLPTTGQIVTALTEQDLTILGFDKVELVAAEMPGEEFAQGPSVKVYDLTQDGSNCSYRVEAL
jgi:hypothetical protein